MRGDDQPPRDRALPLVAVVGALALCSLLVAWWGRELAAPHECRHASLLGVEGARAWLTGERLELNGASAKDIARLPGVGDALARAIVEERARRGGFRALAELDDVRGIGKKKLARLAALVVVEASARPPAGRGR